MKLTSIMVGFLFVAISQATSAFASGCGVTVLYVDSTAPANGDGESWGSAYRYLQDALDRANTCDGGNEVLEIRVAVGTYYPDEAEMASVTDNDRASSFTLSGIAALRGGYEGISSMNPDFQTGRSVLNGEVGSSGYADNVYNVVTLTSTWEGVLIERFNVTNGNADDGDGGGILATCSDLQIADCLLSDNRARRGGGLFAVSSSLSIYGDLDLGGDQSGFSGNVAEMSGGGAYVVASTVSVIDQYLIKNSAGYSGGGVFTTAKFVEVRSTAFNSNYSDRGACTHLYQSGYASFVNSNFISGGGDSGVGEVGGGIWADSVSELAVVSCEFRANQATVGSAVYAIDASLVRLWNSGFSSCEGDSILEFFGESSEIDIRLCSVRDNVMSTGNVIFADVSVFSITNTIVHSDFSADCFDVTASTLTRSFSNIEGQTIGNNGNIDSDPVWASGAGIDCDKSPPGENLGSNALVPLDTYDVDNDLNTSEVLPLDLYGQARIANTTVDMGSDECQ